MFGKDPKDKKNMNDPAKLGRTGKGIEGTLDEKQKEKIAGEIVRDKEKEKKKRAALLSGKADKKEKKEKTAKSGKKEKLFPKIKRIVKEEIERLKLEREADKTEVKDFYRKKGVIDRPMLIIILVLICFGSVMVFSASYAYAYDKTGDSYFYVKKQIIYGLLGIVIMALIALFVDYRWIKKLTIPYFGASALLLVAVLAMGVAEGEAVRWLTLGPLTFQPSETMKLGLVLILAWYYSLFEKKVRDENFWRSSFYGTFAPLVIVGMVCVLIALEKHISGTIIMFAIGMIVIFVAGGKLIWFGGASIVFGLVVAGIISFTDYATKRLDIWLHPENYSVQSEVWQTLQGLYAVGSGGLFGVGLGNSRQKHLFVSQPQNDFIFAIVCEELGMIGALFVVALFIAFVWRGIVIAKRAPDTFSKLTAIGIVSKVAIQAFLNIAVVTNTIPNTGISLPFFSYGGTALIILLVEMGILLSISRYSCVENGS